jgi:hypothetical protein
VESPGRLASFWIAGLTLILGVSAGMAWNWWKVDDRASHTKMLTLMKFDIEDEGCDSGFDVDWLSNSYLVSSTGVRLSKLEVPSSGLDSCEAGNTFFQVLVKPTDSWVYRVEVASPSSSLVVDTFTIRGELEGDQYGPAYVYMTLSADCATGTLLCL